MWRAGSSFGKDCDQGSVWTQDHLTIEVRIENHGPNTGPKDEGYYCSIVIYPLDSTTINSITRYFDSVTTEATMLVVPTTGIKVTQLTKPTVKPISNFGH